jgi:hypothetical protein
MMTKYAELKTDVQPVVASVTLKVALIECKNVYVSQFCGAYVKKRLLVRNKYS